MYLWVSQNNCMYWERRFPRLLIIDQLELLLKKGALWLTFLIYITYDVGISIEILKESTSIEWPFFRWPPPPAFLLRIFILDIDHGCINLSCL